MRHAYYEVRSDRDPRPFFKTGGSLEADFDRAREHAKEVSRDLDYTYEVRFIGYATDPVDGLLVAAFKDGEQLDIRTPAKISEDESRV